jgi:hypothetical protein
MTLAEITQRLTAIAEQKIGSLTMEEIHALLDERAALEEEVLRLRAAERETAETAKREQRQAVEVQIAQLNEQITPSQDDEVLLKLIQKRKELEALRETFGPAPVSMANNVEQVTEQAAVVIPPELAHEKALSGSETALDEPELTSSSVEEVLVGVEEKEEERPVVPPVTASVREDVVLAEAEPVAVVPESKTEAPDERIQIAKKGTDGPLVAAPEEHFQTSYITPSGKVSALSGISKSEERIQVTESPTGEYQEYLEELKANAQSLGPFLQGLPATVKRSRFFMLEVAKIDPAYAIHYADKDTLKKDETFNVSVAALPNRRNTGNPLSEMLPEMRTGQVVLLGVQHDFRNVRFVDPRMPEYDEILAIAKKGVCEALKSQRGAHFSAALVPMVLQKDKAFMAEVEALLKKNE